MNSREYTFQSLFNSIFVFEEKEIILNKIEIPIIQRDYAQGRKTPDVQRIRERFLDALFLSLINQSHITLDFVYGDISNEGVLIPLDGQQRLTTLFLLHWYIAKKERIDESEYEFLQHFTYSTRFSSRDFCQELIKYTPDFTEEILSETIKDQPWYPYEWRNDPTIQGLLVMIDAIHSKFNNQTNIWESLVTNKNISFYFLPLTEMGLTDDLYIKMNSRGKPLTTFEHFKAEFGEIIKSSSEELSKEIIYKFDIKWTDMLFPYRNGNKIIDDEFMRYYHYISDILCYKSELGIERDEFKLANLLYGAHNENAIKNIEYLRKSFDCWCNFDIEDFFKTYFSKEKYEKNKVKLYQDDLNIFKECLDNYGEFIGRNRKFPLNKILLLFAINMYLQNKDNISESEFRERIRMIRNIIWNSSFEIRDDRMTSLLSETEIIMLTGNIPFADKGDLSFNVRQKEEERDKMEWLKVNEHLKDELYHLEDHVLLKGCVSVVDIDRNEHINIFRLLFDNCDKDLISRAMLTFGNYSQLVSWRYQLGARSNESVWYDLFHPSKQRQGFENTYNILNSLLGTLSESEINNDRLENIVEEYLNNPDTVKNWIYYVVKYSQMRQGNFGMFYWKDLSEKPYELIMMNTEKTLGGKNWNVFLNTLFHTSEINDYLILDDFAYQGNKLKIKNSEIEIECLNDRYVFNQNDIFTEYPIPQIDGYDVEDRIEICKAIILEKINNVNILI